MKASAVAPAERAANTPRGTGSTPSRNGSATSRAEKSAANAIARTLQARRSTRRQLATRIMRFLHGKARARDIEFPANAIILGISRVE